MSDLSERLLTLRRQSLLTNAEVAKAIGCSTRSVSRWENGRSTPREVHVHLLAGLYGVRAADLLQTPAPRGAGGVQLDRIEAKLDEVLNRLTTDTRI